MAWTRNPFTPGFGTTPLFLAGRKHILDDMRHAFENGPGDPNLSTIFVGARGTGKTALLSGVEVEAGLAGWISVHVIARPGMLETIYEQALIAAEHLREQAANRQLAGIEVGGLLGIHWENSSRQAMGWQTRMGMLLDELSRYNTGLLVVVDEVKASVDEMLELASTYQIFVGEGKRVALVMAGLPSHVSALVTNEDVSFLRRARHRRLTRIDDGEIELAFRMTAESMGKPVHEQGLRLASSAIQGFPYMLQLVGYYAWALANNSDVILPNHVLEGISYARRELADGVFDATYRELSKGDRAFVHAMLEDEEESRLSDIAKRMGKSNSYASSYKLRLLNHGVIEETLRGCFVFSIPFFREWLEETGL